DEHQLLRGRDAAGHDLRDAARFQRRHRLGPPVLHDGGPAHDVGVPHLHRATAARSRERLRSGHDLPQLAPAPSNVPNPLATRLLGRVEWYYDPSSSGLTLINAGQSLVPGGTALLLGADHDAPLPSARNVLREIDLAGDVIRETNIAAVNAQLTALGHDVIH